MGDWLLGKQPGPLIRSKTKSFGKHISTQARGPWLRTLVRRAALVALMALVAPSAARPQAAEEKVHFPSLDEGATVLDGYLFRPAEAGRRPAVVFLHGCAGLFDRSHDIWPREVAWAARLNALGYVVLMVDSFAPRNQANMCAPGTFQDRVYLARPSDAYGALRYLQAQAFVRPDRIGLMGWSLGGGTVLYAIRKESLGRPAALPEGDFRAAVAFYPASCKESSHKEPWTSAVPLLVLIGASDNWTPAEPCKSFLEGAVARGSPVEMRVYPGAYHDFDWPNMPLHGLESDRTRAGIVPLTGTDPAAREEALVRVPQFLARYLED